MSKPVKVVISGGGTGGHIFPALAIADAIKAQRPTADILFVGAKGRMEMEKVPAAGYPIEGLWISGFQRKVTLGNLLFPVKVVSSMMKARRILRAFRPDIAIGVGGYASGPLLQSAIRLKIPSVIQEQNSFPGATNRILAPQVSRIYTAYPGMGRFFKADKIREFGNPVRERLKISLPDPQAARLELGMDPEKKTLLVFGGSLGAGALNKAVHEAFELLKKRTDIQLIWQTGGYYAPMYSDSLTAALPNVHMHTFLNQMELAYAASDLVVCRAGALTISELALLGKASILVPSPFVAEDHQTHNAMALVSKGAAVLHKETEYASLIQTAMDLLADEKQLSYLQKQILSFSKPNAAEDIADDILKMIAL